MAALPCVMTLSNSLGALFSRHVTSRASSPLLASPLHANHVAITSHAFLIVLGSWELVGHIRLCEGSRQVALTLTFFEGRERRKGKGVERGQITMVVKEED